MKIKITNTAFVEANAKFPVSVLIPVYRQMAISSVVW